MMLVAVALLGLAPVMIVGGVAPILINWASSKAIVNEMAALDAQEDAEDPDGRVQAARARINVRQRALARRLESPFSEQLVWAGVLSTLLGTSILIVRHAAADAGRRRAEAKLGAICDATPDPIRAEDLQGRLIYQNAAADLWAADLECGFVGFPGSRFDTLADRGRIAVADRVVNTRAPLIVRGHTKTRTGDIRHYRATVSPLYGEDGAVIGVVSHTADVTAEQAAAALLEAVSEGNPDLIVATDAAGHFTYANTAFLTFVGKGADQVIGRTREDVFDLGTESDHMAELDAQVLRTGRPERHVASFHTPDGQLRLIDLRKYPLRALDGEIFGIACVGVDVTEASADRERIEASERKFRTISNVVPAIIWSIGPDGEVDFFNDRWFEFTGRPRGQEVLSDISDVIHPDDLADLESAYRESTATGLPYELKLRVRRHSGEYRWKLARAHPVICADGTVKGWLGAAINIDEIVAAQDALESREAIRESILKTIPDPMIVADERGTIVSFSIAAERTFGWSAAEACGRSIGSLLPPLDEPISREEMQQRLSEGLAGDVGRSFEMNALRRDRTVFPAYVTVGDATSADGRFFTIFIRDLTHERAEAQRLRNVQSELAHVSRLSAMGELASGIAHELNQPLAAASALIQGSVRLLDYDPPEIIEVRDALGLAADQVLRAGDIIRSLRSLVAKGSHKRELQDIGVLLREVGALSMLGMRHPDIRLIYEIPPEPCLAIIDRVQIQQVVFNLTRNAMEAMSDSPVRNLTLGLAADLSGWLTVSVQDTGPGVDPEIVARLFEAFVTTKSDGMGVGLSISRTIVEEHGGKIWSETAPDGGAIFRFTLDPFGGGGDGRRQSNRVAS